MSMARTIRILSHVSVSPGTRSGMARLRCEGAYAILVDQPLTNVVAGTPANSPLAEPLTFTGSISLASAMDLARDAGLAPDNRRPWISQRILAVMEFQPAARVVEQARIDGRLFWLKGKPPHACAEHQSAREWRASLSGDFVGQSDSAGHTRGQYHADGKHGKLELQRALDFGRPSVWREVSKSMFRTPGRSPWTTTPSARRAS